jgi:glycosyltransferase involved in cell wall biosynthesis
VKTSDPSSITIIIPAYNEQFGITRQVESIQSVMSQVTYDYEIIIVDDGSSDETKQAALRTGSRVIVHPENRGYGAALKTGILAAKNNIIVIIDADGTYPCTEIPSLVQKLASADMVVGSRTGDNVKVNWIRQPAKWLLRKLAERIAEQVIPDLNSGLRVFRKDCAIQYFAILSNRFSFTTTITLAYLADGYRVIYHPINYYPRIGKSKIIAWHFMDFMALILRMSMMFNPLKIFVPLALFFGGLGGLKMFYDVFALFARSPVQGWRILLEPVLSTSAVLLLFVGLQFLMIGMVADGVVRRIGQYNRPLIPSHGYTSYEEESKLESELKISLPIAGESDDV